MWFMRIITSKMDIVSGSKKKRKTLLSSEENRRKKKKFSSQQSTVYESNQVKKDSPVLINKSKTNKQSDLELCPNTFSSVENEARIKKKKKEKGDIGNNKDSVNLIDKKEKRKTINEEKLINEDDLCCESPEFSKDEDPFMLHFGRNLNVEQGKEITNSSEWDGRFNNWPVLGRCKIQHPTLKVHKTKVKKLLLDDEEDTLLPTVGVIPESPFTVADLTCKCFIGNHLSQQKFIKAFVAYQREMLTIISQYIDVYYPYSTQEKWDKIRATYSLHCLNHILKTNKLITYNNWVIKDLKSKREESNSADFADQGFTRPRVLILVPFKHSAYRVVKTMISQLGLEVKNKKRFETDYGPPPDQKRGPNTNAEIKMKRKPDDFLKFFEGDTKEDFKIGLTITKKSIKLYSEFFQSDIIIASPLGLRYSLDTAKTSVESDFLSSIEVFVMDQADVFLMQNWEHILIILEALNRFPKNLQNLDFDLYRARRWSLDGLSPQYRQTLVFSATNSDLIRAVIAKTNNFAGKIQVLQLPSSGSLSDVSVRAELILQRVKTSPSALCHSADDQFTFFTKELLPRLRSKDLSHTLLFVPDYCDYIRIVRYMKEDGGTSISTINEYMIQETAKVAKARGLFFEGKRRLLVYTERFHFYKRDRIKGVQHVIFYGLPTYPHFFPEICNFMTEELQNQREPPPSGLNTVTVPFQSFDAAKLVNLLGASKAAQILNSDKGLHVTVTGQT